MKNKESLPKDPTLILKSSMLSEHNLSIFFALFSPPNSLFSRFHLPPSSPPFFWGGYGKDHSLPLNWVYFCTFDHFHLLPWILGFSLDPFPSLPTQISHQGGCRTSQKEKKMLRNKTLTFKQTPQSHFWLLQRLWNKIKSKGPLNHSCFLSSCCNFHVNSSLSAFHIHQLLKKMSFLTRATNSCINSAGRCPTSRCVWWPRAQRRWTSCLIFPSAHPLAHSFKAVPSPKQFLPCGTPAPALRLSAAMFPRFMGGSGQAAARMLASCHSLKWFNNYRLKYFICGFVFTRRRWTCGWVISLIPFDKFVFGMPLGKHWLRMIRNWPWHHCSCVK